MTARDHNNLLGIFFLILGGMAALGGIFMTLIYGGIGIALIGAGTRSDDQIAGGVMFVVGIIIGLVILAIAALYLFTGFKIRKQASIGRTLGIVASILSLFSFPLGTALGIYGLWFFLGDLGRGLYSSTGQATYSQPPPNSWR
jgi:hypothetical protein